MTNLHCKSCITTTSKVLYKTLNKSTSVLPGILSLELTKGICLKTKAIESERVSGLDDWGGMQWATFSTRTTRYRAIVEKTRPSSIIQLIKEGRNPARRVDITRMEYVDVQKRGPPIRHGCPPHEDGEADVPSITTVYVVYVDERNNTIMEGSSADYGGGLHYGNGTSGRLKRRQHGHLTIPSGSTYIFPGYFVEHSVAPLKTPGVIRSGHYCLRPIVK